MINHKIRYNILRSHLAKNESSSILEVGCGSQGLGQYFKNTLFTGVDNDFGDYGANRQTHVNMRAIKASALDLPFENDEFDITFSLDMIEHIPEKLRKKAVKELIRVTGDKLVIAFPCGDAARRADEEQLAKLLSQKKAVPGWLNEHVELDYPDESLVLSAIPDDCSTDFYWHESIKMHRITQKIEQLTKGTSYIDPLLPFWLINLLDKKGQNFYRLVIVVNKKGPNHEG